MLTPRSSLLLLALLVAPGSVAEAKPEAEPVTLAAPPDGLPDAPQMGPVRLGSLAIGAPVGMTGTVAVPNIQAETSVAASGSDVVIAFNDFRGFYITPRSLTGIVHSSDGGATFTDLGPLPTLAGSSVSGDPVVAVHEPPSGPAVFYCSSVYGPPEGGVSLCIHRSTDGGATWDGPFEVTSATSATDKSEDKEWCTVDPETGRLFISWTRFLSNGSVRIMVTYSDDGGASWSTAEELGTSGQGTVLAADPNGPNVYVAWRVNLSGGKGAIRFAKSTDNGASWGSSGNLSPDFHRALPPYGFDRYNSFPSMAVNPADGAIELVYAASVDGTPSTDFGDIYYRRSTNAGSGFSSPVALNPFAGADRPQIMPTVSAADDGRIDVFWYDESAGSGVSDLTDLFYTFSSDFGATWSSPVPVTPTPFHNEAGNNYGAPHQGDYIDAYSAAAGYGAFAWFGDPSPLGTWPDPMAAVITGPAEAAALRLRPGSESLVDFGCGADDGFLVAGESAALTVPLENFGRITLDGIQATLTSLTPHAAVTVGVADYPSLSPGDSGPPVQPLGVALDALYPCGVPAKFRLEVSASGVAPSVIEFSLPTGVTVAETLLYAEDFDGVQAPGLPAGWSTSSVCGSCSPNDWVTTTSSASSPPNAAYVDDADYTSHGRLTGPVVEVPAGATHLEVRFDLRYDLEEKDERTAYDAASLGYVLDETDPTRFATADALSFEPRYAHYVVRASGNGRGDRSGWSGDSGGYRSVRLVIPDMGGHSLTPQFDLTTDSDTHETGVWVDNVAFTAITMGCGPCAPLAVAEAPPGFSFGLSGPNPFIGGTWLRYELPDPGPVRIELIDVTGRRVATLVDRHEAAGRHTLALGTAAGRARLAPGVYLARITTAEGRRTMRLVALGW